MPRARRQTVHLTFAPDFIEAAEARAKEMGESLSRFLEAAGRAWLALPAPPVAEDEYQGLKGSEATILDVLRQLGPGGHTAIAIEDASGLSPGIVKRGLFALQRSGKVCRRGEGLTTMRHSDGTTSLCVSSTPGPDAWGVGTALDEAAAAIAAWKASGGIPWDVYRPMEGLDAREAVTEKLERIAETSDDVEAIRQLIASELGIPRFLVTVSNVTERRLEAERERARLAEERERAEAEAKERRKREAEEEREREEREAENDRRWRAGLEPLPAIERPAPPSRWHRVELTEEEQAALQGGVQATP